MRPTPDPRRYRFQTSSEAFLPARPSLARTCLNAAGRTAGGAALLTALFGHGGERLCENESDAAAKTRAVRGALVFCRAYNRALDRHRAGYRYEVRRRLFADGDAAQISLAAALASLDLTVLLVTLRAAPFAVAPFVVWTLVV